MKVKEFYHLDIKFHSIFFVNFNFGVAPFYLRIYTEYDYNLV